MHTTRKPLLLLLTVLTPILAASRISRAEVAEVADEGRATTTPVAPKRQSVTRSRIPGDDDLVGLVDRALVTWPSTAASERPTARLSMPHAMIAYDEESKDAMGALALELFVLPGAGSLYAHDTRGFMITWAGLASGVGLILYGLPALFEGFPDQPQPPPPVDNRSLRLTAALGGMALMVGARVYSIANAVNAVGRYNESLRQCLGLTPTFSLSQASSDGGSVDGVIPGVAGRF